MFPGFASRAAHHTVTSRRSVLGRMALAAIATRAIPAATGAQATPATGHEEPNTFRLAGDDGLEIIYATTSITGAPTLGLRGPATDLEFTGEQIRQDTSPFGDLVTVMIGSVADEYTEELTLVLPEINPAPGSAATGFSTLAIVTRHLTTIAGPGMIDGAVQRYEVLPLEGTAESLRY